MNKIIAFANRKGGSGKTTSAVNVAARMAAYLANEKKRVLLIDIDPQGNAATALGVDPDGRCISDLLTGEATLKDVILPAGDRRPNLFIVPSSDRLQEAAQEIRASDITRAIIGRQKASEVKDTLNTVLRESFAPYVDLFEYIVIDCPPTLGVLDDALFDFATDIVVPVRMAYLDTTGAKQHLENVVAARENGAQVRISYILPTFFRERELVARANYDQLREVYGRAVVRPIPQTTQIEQSQAIDQQTIFEYAPTSPAAKAYDYLTRKLMGA